MQESIDLIEAERRRIIAECRLREEESGSDLYSPGAGYFARGNAYAPYAYISCLSESLMTRIVLLLI